MGAQQTKNEVKSPSLPKQKPTIKNKDKDTRVHINSGNIFTAHSGLLIYYIYNIIYIYLPFIIRMICMYTNYIIIHNKLFNNYINNLKI